MHTVDHLQPPFADCQRVHSHIDHIFHVIETILATLISITIGHVSRQHFGVHIVCQK